MTTSSRYRRSRTSSTPRRATLTRRARYAHRDLSFSRPPFVSPRSATNPVPRPSQTAKESNDQVQRRNQEFASLRAETAHLKSLVAQLKTQNDSLATDAAVQVAAAEDLRRRLSASERAKQQLERDVTDTRDRHLELVSRMHVDDRQRVSALNRLRRPRQYHYPSSNDSPDALAPDTPSPAPSSDAGAPHIPLAAIAVAKSPSESFLLGLHPNLAPDASDDEIDLDPPVFHAKPPRAREAAAEAGARRRARANGGREGRVRAETLELPRAPWVDALAPGLQGVAKSQSLAQALAGVDVDAPGVCRSRGDASGGGSVSAD